VVPETFEKARRVAPGWDIYFLEGLWRDWIAGKEEPKTRMPLLSPSAAKSINGKEGPKVMALQERRSPEDKRKVLK
jgi:hypothetical protein